MSRSPRIHILTPSLVPYDAISNDVTQMRRVLLDHGYSVSVFVPPDGIHPHCKAIAQPLTTAPNEFWESPDDILIYHHSMGWPSGEEILFKSRNKVLIRYHNITPPRFFAPYSIPHMQACEAGLESTERMARLPGTTILGDSTFNCADFVALGTAAQDCRVLPPLHLTEELGREPFDIPTVQQYSGDTVNILFVGGVKPNKGHGRAIRVFAEYRRHFNDRARLIFAGGIDDRLQGYIDELKRLAARLGVADATVFTGPVTGSQMKSLYVASDVFLCTSEHEGFCVPLVEAMYFRSPIVAWSGSAVTETVGNCGFLLDGWDEFHFASQIGTLIDDADLAARFGDLGRRRYQEMFAFDVLSRKLCDIVAEAAETRTTRHAAGMRR